MADAVIIEPRQTHRASIIWLHGLGADGNDFAPIVAELGLGNDAGIRFIFPHAPKIPVTINGGMIMRAWYDIRDPDLGKGRDRSEFDDSARILADWINREIEAGIAPGKIIAAGFSQGGAVALHCGLLFPQRLAGLLILSSYLPFAGVMEEQEAQANRNVPILMMHGEFDPVVPISFAKQSFEALKENHYHVEWHDFPMQHGVCIEEIKHIGDWISTVLREH